MRQLEERYLERLSQLYPTIAKASTEIINLQAILNLPKGTEHFLTDIHGEYEAFAHVLKNGSGSVKRKVDDVFANTMSSRDKQTLATLIYYPREKMERILKKEENPEDWYKITLYRLIEVCKRTASKYTRSKVRKALPPDFAYVIEELITEKNDMTDKESYYNAIVSTIIRIGRAEKFIIAMSELIQRLTVDHLHIVGDIYDRGPGPHIIMDELMAYHSVDIQWGNHDVLWMGAAAGQRGCIANVIRICARYGNLDILEEGYGINLLPLATFAMNTYKDDPCECFKLKGNPDYNATEMLMDVKMHKAISVIQFKVESQIIKKNPGFKLEKRNLLHHINYEKGTIELDGKEYKLLDKNFPTIDPKKPYALTKEEEDIMERLELLMKGESFVTHIDTGVIYPQIQNDPSSVYSFLLVAGYLKAVSCDQPYGEDYMCEVALPNKEISFVYSKEILSQLENIIPRSVAIAIQEAIYKADIESLQKALEKFLLQTISFHDAADETFYHGLILGMCAVMDNSYHITSNREAGDGRFDIQMLPLNKRLPGILIELKAGKDRSETQLEDLANVALQQINDRAYSVDLQAMNVTSIIKIGIAFSGKRTRIAAERQNIE